MPSLEVIVVITRAAYAPLPASSVPSLSSAAAAPPPLEGDAERHAAGQTLTCQQIRCHMCEAPLELKARYSGDAVSVRGGRNRLVHLSP